MSGGNGGGGNFFQSAINSITPESLNGEGNFFENLGSDLLNLTFQGSTFGQVGYGDGKVTGGATAKVAESAGQSVVSGLKEVTGAKAAEDANTMARQQFEQAKADAETARVTAQNQTAMDQVNQSKAAAAARNSTSRTTKRGDVSLALGQDERDFLGL